MRARFLLVRETAPAFKNITLLDCSLIFQTVNLKYFIVFVAGMAALAGCQEASEYIPSIYITEAQRVEAVARVLHRKAEFVRLRVDFAAYLHEMQTRGCMCHEAVRGFLHVIRNQVEPPFNVQKIPPVDFIFE